jgi:NADP-dependent alcohol dehydrogenase
MERFDYYNPTRIINGKITQKEIGPILNNDNIKSVLLVYGMNSIKKSGLLNEITSILDKNNIKVIEHPGVKSNPVVSHANSGVSLAKKHNVDAILAVGGGSVLDESKAIAAGAKTDCDVWDFYTGRFANDALPLYAILTLSATGSEMNSTSVLTNENSHEKFFFKSPHIFPKVSIINPELTYNLPMDCFAYSAVDVIAHTVEVYFTAKTLPLIQKRFMENIIKTVIETTEKIIKKPKDYDARAEFSLAATWALNNLTTLGPGKYSYPNHWIEHSLSAIYDVPHGAGLAVILPAWMKWSIVENNEIFQRFAEEIFDYPSAEEGIMALERWFKKIGAPTTLQDLLINKKDITIIAKNAFLTTSKEGMSEKYSIEVIKEILCFA